MWKLILSIFVLFTTQCSFAQGQALFRIVENDKVGYIDATGKVVIKPVYLNGNDFSEGLAAVRQHGKFGFIDGTGNFVIRPVFDFATKFTNGLAIVYKKDQPFIVDKTGSTVLPTGYEVIKLLDDKKALVTTPSDKKGIIDIRSGKFVIDTIFKSIGEFKYGVAIVHEYTPPGFTGDPYRIGVIDSTGKFVVPYGEFALMRPFSDGVSIAVKQGLTPENYSTDYIVDTHGKVLFEKVHQYDKSFVDGDFHEGIAVVGLYKYWLPQKRAGVASSDKMYVGFIDQKGEVVLNDTTYEFAYNFSCGRAFVRPPKDKHDNLYFYLLDRNFRRINTEPILRIPAEGFKNGYAIVVTKEGTGMIDTSGHFVIKPEFYDIDEKGIVDGHFFAIPKSQNELYGLYDLDGKAIYEPVIQSFDRHFINGVIRVMIDDRLTYINTRGKIIWQQQKDTSKGLKNLDIDFMNRGYFYAYSSPKNTPADKSSGWAVSPNKPHQISNALQFPDNQFTVTIDINQPDTFDKRYHGFKVFVANKTLDTIKFNAQDSRLYMTLQAREEDGEWKDIEYLPGSDCGNSYHKVELEPNAYWDFTIPDYHGGFKTKIRAVLQYLTSKNSDEGDFIISNTIDGSINPGQFWNKREYYPTGLMDPYRD